MRRLLPLMTILLVPLAVRAQEAMLYKARSILLPTLEYRSITVREIIADIEQKSIDLDPEGVGINFLLLLDDEVAEHRLTMTLREPTIAKALAVIAATVGLDIHYEPRIVRIQSRRDTEK